jgi:hypothetical protein
VTPASVQVFGVNFKSILISLLHNVVKRAGNSTALYTRLYEV